MGIQNVPFGSIIGIERVVHTVTQASQASENIDQEAVPPSAQPNGSDGGMSDNNNEVVLLPDPALEVVPGLDPSHKSMETDEIREQVDLEIALQRDASLRQDRILLQEPVVNMLVQPVDVPDSVLLQVVDGDNDEDMIQEETPVPAPEPPVQEEAPVPAP